MYICGEGGLRFLGFEPSLTVKNNPAKEILEIECKVIENGNYSLEIIDLSGRVATVKEFAISTDSEKILDFEIDVSKFGNGSYIIVLNTPTNKYSARFVVQK